jgi:hypothetical protein
VVDAGSAGREGGDPSIATASTKCCHTLVPGMACTCHRALHRHTLFSWLFIMSSRTCVDHLVMMLLFVVECTHVDEDDGVIAKVEER